MRPVETPETNRVFKLVGGTSNNDLPLVQTTDEYGHIVLVSTWELSADELASILISRRIELCVWGQGTPPVSLSVVKL